LLSSNRSTTPQAWSPDGRLLVFLEDYGTAGFAMGVLTVTGQHQQRRFAQARFVQIEPTFSPDGRWLAYVSNESGRYEVYVQPFPMLDGKWQVSTEGGREPVWARSGREIFYRNGGKMMQVSVTTQPSFHAANPRILFEGRYAADHIVNRNYDVTADGQRFVMVKPSEQELAATQINVVLNWFEDLKRRAGPGEKQ
jgi:eukaryotic-like serine/threonine-protein kinase